MVVQHGGMDKICDKESLLSGNAMTEAKTKTIQTIEAVGKGVRYDLIGDLVRETGLTRHTIISILKGINADKFYQFRVNPEEFIIKVANLINEAKAIAVIKKIEYHISSQTYDTDLFTTDEVRGVIGDNAMESAKSLYDLVVVDSKGTEMQFANALETTRTLRYIQSSHAVFTSIPRWGSTTLTGLSYSAKRVSSMSISLLKPKGQ